MTARERILTAARELVLTRGFGSTTVDAVLEESGASKGGFFHHFASKSELGRALVEQYAREDAETLDRYLARAEEMSDDPAEQLVAFVRLFEDLATDEVETQPGCLFVSFIYERELSGDEIAEVVRDSIVLWRRRILQKLEEAAESHPPARPVDLPSLADQFFTVVEGGILLGRAIGDPTRVGRQLAHLRHYLSLLFDLDGAAGR